MHTNNNNNMLLQNTWEKREIVNYPACLCRWYYGGQVLHTRFIHPWIRSQPPSSSPSGSFLSPNNKTSIRDIFARREKFAKRVHVLDTYVIIYPPSLPPSICMQSRRLVGEGGRERERATVGRNWIRVDCVTLSNAKITHNAGSFRQKYDIL